MATSSHNHNVVSMDTPITIKVSVNDNLKKLKLPMRDLGATVLPGKLRHLLAIKPEQTVVFERFSDSAGGFITLDPSNPQVFKTLLRAAKAKGKLRLKATVSPVDQPQEEKQTIGGETAQKGEPLIVSTPMYQNSLRDSTALDRRSVGSGIFQFREARASEQTLVNTDEAPVPRPFTTERKDIFKDLILGSMKPAPAVVLGHPGHPWIVHCNECDKVMPDAHYHCSICHSGDYDLCEECVASGKLCPGEGHWLIKRSIKDGKVVSSTTEKVLPRSKSVNTSAERVDEKKEMPGTFAEDTKTLAEEPRMPTRTCNSCVVVLPEREFVTCSSCEDYDLCMGCHTSNKHGHHPAHGFKPATEETLLPLSAEPMLAPGRNARHNAICDGCDKKIYGVRHKCLNCPDWDFCNECVKDARTSHPRHRFAAIYEPIADQYAVQVRHYGIYCDGPLCGSNQSYITGVRYKCAVCHDTDFCASCEAHPGNHHNRTHPLIKFKTPVRNVSITTENEDLRGNVRMMGDRRATASASTETTPVSQANAATQVQTMAEIKPVDIKQETQPIPVFKSEEKRGAPIDVPDSAAVVNCALLNAHFVHDSIPDGMILQPAARFTQIWTLKNPGPYAWPAGCSVRYVGGDNMLNVDNGHPSSVSDLADASESNVVGREIQVGEEVAFKVTLKAPTREGKSISYWRLKAADGTPFGHRLWCDVEIKTPEVPKPAVSQIPITQSGSPRFDRLQAMRMHQQAKQAREAKARRLNMEQMTRTQQSVEQAMPSTAPPAYEALLNMPIRQPISPVPDQEKRHAQLKEWFARAHTLQAAGMNPVAGPSSSPSLLDDDKARKEAAKQRVEHIKAKIMRTREERAKAAEAQRAAAAEQKSAEEIEKVKKIIEEVSKSAAAEAEAEKAKSTEEEEMEGSQMVFPKLEKESPASSTYQSATSSATAKGKAAYVENEAGEVERSAVPAAAVSEPAVSSPSEDDFDDLSEDIEVLSAADADESEDDGFMTDEEYDILDASDNETVASK